jgi:diguanylate cyclase (GGDEF)-like protein
LIGGARPVRLRVPGAIIVPNTTPDEAQAFVPALREPIVSATIAAGDGRCGVTASVGVAPVTPETVRGRDVLSLADTAMYQAKQARAAQS